MVLHVYCVLRELTRLHQVPRRARFVLCKHFPLKLGHRNIHVRRALLSRVRLWEAITPSVVNVMKGGAVMTVQFATRVLQAPTKTTKARFRVQNARNTLFRLW